MANGDSNGEKNRKIMLAARRDALAVVLGNYVGDHNGRLDLTLAMQSADAEYRRLSVST
jgi:hypothetical protein